MLKLSLPINADNNVSIFPNVPTFESRVAVIFEGAKKALSAAKPLLASIEFKLSAAVSAKVWHTTILQEL
jgi:hypothetical protein